MIVRFQTLDSKAIHIENLTREETLEISINDDMIINDENYTVRAIQRSNDICVVSLTKD